MNLNFNQGVDIKDDFPIMAKRLWEKVKIDSWPFDWKELPAGSALVGGAVRDALLNRLDDKPDLDLVVPSNAIHLVSKLAKQLEGTSVILDKERGISRLIWKGWTIDVADLCGNRIEDDLCRRDYTMNSIALTLEKNPRIIDPNNGLDHLKRKTLVAVCEQNLIDDPLRLLRGFRLIAEINLQLDDQTYSWIRTHAGLLNQSSPERVQSEILRIVKSKSADYVLPRILETRILDSWNNSSNISNKLFPSLINAKFFNTFEKSIAMPLARLTYLLNDSGLCKLGFSKKQRESCRILRFWQIKNDGIGFRSLKELDRFQLHKDLENHLPALILNLSPEDQFTWLKRWRDTNDPLFHPSSPLDGNTLKDYFDLPEGPELGELINHLCQEKAFGRLHNRDEALKSARDWLNKMRPYCD